MATHEIEPTTPGAALPPELVANTTGSAVGAPKVSGEFSVQDDQLDGTLMDLGLDQEAIGVEADEEATANVLVEPPVQNEQEHEPTRFDRFWCSTAGRKTTAFILALGLSGAACSSSSVEGEQPEPNPIEVTTTSETAVEDLTLSEMLDQFVDENGMPNRKIEFETTNPVEFVDIFNHNIDCAVNTRDASCAKGMFLDDESKLRTLQGFIDRDYVDSRHFLLTKTTEPATISSNSDGKTVATADIYSYRLLLRTDGRKGGWSDQEYVLKIILAKSSDGRLVAETAIDN